MVSVLKGCIWTRVKKNNWQDLSSQCHFSDLRGLVSLMKPCSFCFSMTLSRLFLQMELTNDVQALLPVMVSVMVAKWVGDFFTHPIYHALLELKCIPFLDPEPRVRIDTSQ